MFSCYIIKGGQLYFFFFLRYLDETLEKLLTCRYVAIIYLVTVCFVKYCIKQKQHKFHNKIFYIHIGNADACALQMTGVFKV